MVVCLYNCEGLKTLHELGAKLRKFNELEKKKGEKDVSWVLQGKILQMVIIQMVISRWGRKGAVFETLKSVIFAIKALSLQQKIGMRRTFYLISIVAMLAFGCQTHRSNNSLVEVDSLVVAELYDSAYQTLMAIDERNISTDADRAHYNLLKVQTSLLTSQPVSADSLLNGVIAYYEEHVDHEKLADAYYYKAICEYKKKDPQQSIVFYKKAEQQADLSGDLRQKYKISEGITHVNGVFANYDLQLQYAKKTLELSKKIGNKGWIAYSYFWVGYAYYNMEKDDSVLYYLGKTQPYIDFINKRDKPIFLSNIGYFLRDTNPKEAIKYLKESLKLQELTNTYEYLAEIYYDEGKKEEAYNLRKKALLVQDATPKDDVLHNIIEYDIERGKTDSICERVNEIIAIRDSIDDKLKNDTIKDLQTRFDHEVAMREKDQTIIRWQWGILAAILVIVGLAAYSIIKRYRSSMVLKNYQMQIIDYTNQIREMELASEDYSKQIETLSQEVKQIMDEKSPRLSEGRMLYDSIMEGRPIVKWSADDERKFIEYFTATNYRLISHLRKEPRRENLTDHKLIYLLLKEMGKTDKEVCDIMGLSDAGLRSIRNRTKPLKEATG